MYFLTLLHRNPGIFSPYVWTLPSKSYLPLCLIQEYSYLCGLGGDVTDIDKTWYDELIYDKEVELLDLVKLGCVSGSGIITHEEGYDVPDTQRAYVII